MTDVENARRARTPDRPRPVDRASRRRRPAALEFLEPRVVLSVGNVSSFSPLGETLTGNWGSGAVGAAVPFVVSAVPPIGAAALRVSVTGDGVFAGARQTAVLSAPWAASAAASLSFSATPAGPGAGHLAATVTAVDASGRTLAVDQADAFALYKDGRVWTSPSSMTDLESNRLVALHDAGRIDDPAFQSGLVALVTAVPVPQPAPTIAAAAVHAAAAPPPTTVTISGTVQWTDGAGGKHGLPRAPMNVYETDGTNLTLLSRAATSQQGTYSIVVTPTTAARQVVVRVYASSSYGSVMPDILLPSPVYQMDSPINSLSGVSAATIDLTAPNTTDAGRAFAVDAAMEMVGTYAAGLTGQSLPSLSTFYPEKPKAGEPASGISQYSSAANAMYVRGTAWNQFDVTDHEYGHYVASAFKFDQSLGGMHSSQSNITPLNGNPAGVRLAWSEGWATYFSISGQIAAGYAALNIPNVGDHSYTGLSSYSLDTLPATGRALGEDNEGSVQGVLFQMFLTGQSAGGGGTLSYTDKTIFDIIKTAKPITVGAFWDAAATKLDAKGKAELGKIFSDLNVAPTPTAPADNFDASKAAAPPTFKWKRNGAGTPNPADDFIVQFFSSDFSKVVFTSPASETTLDDNDNASFTPTADEWRTILAGGANVKWVVQSKNTVLNTPGGTPGRYWGPARTVSGGITISFVIDITGSMSNEIGAVRAALQSFIDLVALTVPAGGKGPVMQLITFVDSPSIRLTTDDTAAMRSAVGGLGAGGGGDCPEPSASALKLAIDNISPGGSILLVTDASSDPGTDLSGLIASARAKGVTVAAEISGDCSGIDSPGGDAGPGPAAASLGAAGTTGATTADATAADCDCNGVGPAATTSADVGLPASAGPMTASVTAAATRSEPDAGGTSEPPRGDIDVVFGPPDDPNGGDPATATRLTLGPLPVRGVVPNSNPTGDYFVASLVKGTQYAIEVHSEEGPPPRVTIFGSDGTTPLDSAEGLRVLESGQTLNRYVIPFTPAASGDYFVRVSGSDAANPSFFRVAVKADPLAGVVSSVQGFSAVASQTGGSFIVRDSIKHGDPTSYKADVLNVMATTLGPGVIVASPGGLPRGETLSVSLTARGTSWRQGSTSVAFAGAGLTVLGVTVTSPTTLTALVQVDPTAANGFRGVTVTSTLGAGTVAAVGRNVVQVSDPVTSPTLLSVESNSVFRGETADVVVRGAKTAWDATSRLTLGPGVKVNAFTVVSPTMITASVTVDPAAGIGFRTATVNTGASTSVSQSRALFVNIGAISSVPVVVSLTPPSTTLGATVTVAVQGTNTHFQQGLTTADFGAGVAVTSVTVTDATHASVTVVISPTAALGFRDVVMTTGTESAALLRGFFLDTTSARLVSITPGSASPGEQLDVTLTVSGTTVDPASRVTLGNGITVSSERVIDAHTLRFTVLVAPGAPLGTRDVVLTGTGGVFRFAGAFTVAENSGVTDPRVVALERTGYHARPTVLTVAYDAAMDPVSASNPANYVIYDLGLGYHPGARPVHRIKVGHATYDQASQSVSFLPAHRLPLRHLYKLVIRSGPGGVQNAQGAPLDGAKNGRPGANAAILFGPEILKNGPHLTLGRHTTAQAHAVAHAHAVPRPSRFR